ncbi:MAG: RpiB/LacA/LacB family sugar-phosphate isomerase [Patescibacteria group bacterium]
MVIYIGADHRGFRLKEAIKNFLRDRGYQIFDVGNETYDEQDDYVDFAKNLARKVNNDYENSKGILVCGSGVGMSITANKFRNVRAALLTTPDQAFDARNDEDVNVLVLPADYLTSDVVRKILITWIETPFSREERFRRRLDKLQRIEEGFIRKFSDVERKEEL